MNVLSITGVSFAYRSRPVLENIEFTVAPHDFAAIIGPNGGGKSTLLQLVMGLLRPQSGEISLFDMSVTKGRRFVGYLPQFSNVDWAFPIHVFDVVMHGLMANHPLRFWPTKSDRNTVMTMLESLGIAHLATARIGNLSGGQRQRAFLARALITHPKLLILDEPTNNVDSEFESALYQKLHDLTTNMAILIVSHDISAVSAYATKIGCLNKRMICHSGNEFSATDIESTYGCNIELISHGPLPHRVLKHHD